MKKYSLGTYLALFIGTLLVDRLTKAWAIAKLTQPSIINSFWSFELVYNRGVSWSLLNFADNTFFFILSVFIGLILIGVAFYTYIRWMNHYSIVGELLVLSGGISNLIDRFFYPGVIDFIHFSANGWSFPIFNFADVFIVIGVGIIILCNYTKS